MGGADGVPHLFFAAIAAHRTAVNRDQIRRQKPLPIIAQFTLAEARS
jgi:hypothetical protein